ncbi:MAG: metallophosphoesterase [Acidobacteriota bacterium]
MLSQQLSTYSSRVRLLLGIVAASALVGSPQSAFHAQDRPLLRFGMVTDVHYADIDDVGNRHYREAADRLAEFVRVMNQAQVDFVIELGDFKDQDRTPDETRTLGYLRHIESVFAVFDGPRFHVLGNHDLDSITKEQFRFVAPNVTWMVRGDKRVLGPSWRITTPTRTYDFPALSWTVRRRIRIVMLDANYKSDGGGYSRGNFEWADTNVGWEQIQRLELALAQSDMPAIVFVHQQLDGEGPYYVKDAADVRKVLEESGKVLAVFQGHRHEGAFSVINGIPYYTLRALVEGPGNAFALVTVDPDSSVWVTGYGRAESRGFRSTALDAYAVAARRPRSAGAG